jgi:hypothetical protein
MKANYREKMAGNSITINTAGLPKGSMFLMLTKIWSLGKYERLS